MKIEAPLAAGPPVDAAYQRAYREAHREELAAYQRNYNEKHREDKATRAHAWYETHRPETIARALKWNKAHPKNRASIGRAYREANPGQEAARTRAWRAMYPERAAASAALWAATHPEHSKAHDYRRRAAIAKAPGTATAAQIAARWAYYGGRCYLCGGVATGTDHVKPLAQGGPNWPSNLRPACGPCNSAKGARWL